MFTSNVLQLRDFHARKVFFVNKSRHAEIFWEDVKKKMFPKNRFDLTAQNHLLGFHKELLILSNCTLGRLPKNRFNAFVL